MNKVSKTVAVCCMWLGAAAATTATAVFSEGGAAAFVGFVSFISALAGTLFVTDD